ncbi:hypothetical protein LCGC14_2234440, partial [marine sediment metagenome]
LRFISFYKIILDIKIIKMNSKGNQINYGKLISFL